MKAALKVAEQASPCVLWIDELEKAFSGINGTGEAQKSQPVCLVIF
jgi:SpoVK/Ycf46/Vps4 family AAA+-type ATPase